MKTGEILKGLDVEDEAMQDCVRIEGVVYSKELFRSWGVNGLAIGAKYRLVSREPDGVITIAMIRD